MQENNIVQIISFYRLFSLCIFFISPNGYVHSYVRHSWCISWNSWFYEMVVGILHESISSSQCNHPQIETRLKIIWKNSANPILSIVSQAMPIFSRYGAVLIPSFQANAFHSLETLSSSQANGMLAIARGF